MKSTTMQKTNSQVLFILFLSFFIMSPIYAADEEAVEESNYYEISPPFVVNLKTDEKRMRFLQVRIQVLGVQSAIDEVSKHNAPIRDVIITALSSQNGAHRGQETWNSIAPKV